MNYTAADMRIGSTIRAFHPARFGVVNTGDVRKVGRKYVLVDFGQLFGGTYRVPFAHVTDIVGY